MSFEVSMSVALMDKRIVQLCQNILFCSSDFIQFTFTNIYKSVFSVNQVHLLKYIKNNGNQLILLSSQL